MQLVLLALGASLSGCYATWDVSHHELAKLDGYRAPQTVVLKSTDGADVTFGPKSHLITDEDDVRLASASVEKGTFIGVAQPPATTTARVKLTADGKVIVAEPSRFLAATGAVALGVMGAVLLVIIVAPGFSWSSARDTTK
jgi:hypothetical protein